MKKLELNTYYYIGHKDDWWIDKYERWYDRSGGYRDTFRCDNEVEVLDKVPTYEEYQAMKEELAIYKKELSDGN